MRIFIALPYPQKIFLLYAAVWHIAILPLHCECNQAGFKSSLTYCSRSIKYKVFSAAWQRLKFKMIQYKK